MIDLDAIRARCEAATKGPWDAHRFDREGGEIVYQLQQGVPPAVVIGHTTGDLEHQGNRADAAFIAHARDDVPALAAEVERLRGDGDALRGSLADALERHEADMDALREQWREALARAEAAESALASVRDHLRWVRATEVDPVVLAEMATVEHDERELERDAAVEALREVRALVAELESDHDG